MNVRVKICGITSLADARVAVDAGADALGFMFYPESPRRVTPAQAAVMAAQLPPFEARGGVFVNPDRDFVREASAAVGLDAPQCHGEATPAFCQSFARPHPVIKAWRGEEGAWLTGWVVVRDA